MSEEKLYVVKNDEGLILLYSEQGTPLWRVWGEMFADKPAAERAAHAENGHVVTFVEEPEKIVLTKEQAEIVDDAHSDEMPAGYIFSKSDDEELLMKAYVNGYTVAKEKKYNLILGTETDGNTNALFKNNPCTDAVLCIDADTYADDLKRDKFYQFTQEEIDKFNKDFWIKNIDLNDYKVEVPIDD